MFDGAKLGAEMVTAVKDFVARAISPAENRIAALEARIVALESRKQLSYAGVWKEGEAYAAGEIVTLGGSAWHCNAPTSSRPGDDSSFTLMVKRGRDGR